MKSILVVGGNGKESFEQKAQEMKMEVVYHSAWNKRKSLKRTFERLVRDTDCVILLPDACSHQSMWDVRGLSKQYGKPVVYQKGRGVTQALKKAYELLH